MQVLIVSDIFYWPFNFCSYWI